jgi:hypothetical protein
MGELEFRRLRRGDEQGLSRVVREVLSVETDPAYWDWKYFQNPAGEHMVTVAVDDGEIVGVQGYLPGRLKCDSRVLLSAQNLDMAVLAAYRTGGTFLKMHDKAMEYGPKQNAALCYGFPNETAYRLAPCLEYTGICPIFNLTKLLNPIPYIQRKMGVRFFAQAVGSVGKRVVAWRYGRKPGVHPNTATVEVERFDERFDEFWRQEAVHYPIAVVRDSKYLNWRYIDGPTSYKIFCAEKDHRIKGFVVLRCVQDRDIKRGKVVDILVEWSQETIAELLVERSLSYFAGKNVDVVTSWIFEQWPVFETFRKKGFAKRRAPHYLVVNSQSVDIPKEYFLDASKWYVTMGDSDYC